MDPNFLEFEQPIAELQAKISELRFVTDDSDINISREIKNLERKADSLTNSIFGKLTAWQISQLSRHPNRPYSIDYIERMFSDFEYKMRSDLPPTMQVSVVVFVVVAVAIVVIILLLFFFPSWSSSL